MSNSGKNTLVTIGPLGNKLAYLNIDKEKATERYLGEYPEYADNLNRPGFINEFEFDDVFEVYDAWPT